MSVHSSLICSFNTHVKSIWGEVLRHDKTNMHQEDFSMIKACLSMQHSCVISQIKILGARVDGAVDVAALPLLCCRLTS